MFDFVEVFVSIEDVPKFNLGLIRYPLYGLNSSNRALTVNNVCLTCTSGSSLTRSSSLVLIELAEVSEKILIRKLLWECSIFGTVQSLKDKTKGPESEIICRLSDQLCM